MGKNIKTFAMQKGNFSLYELIFLMSAVIFLSLPLFAHAATCTWNGGGADNLASNPGNWTGNVEPHDSDSVFFDSLSTKDCTWEAYLNPASLNLNPGYTGMVTLNSELMVIDNVTISDGTLIINNALMIGVTMGTTPPYAPANLAATAISSAQIDLSWTDNSSNETGFKIERKTGANGVYGEIGNVGANITTYVDVGLSSNTTYYYRVRAYNASGDSSYSNEASAATSPSSIITLTITSPPNGATINGPDVGVMGTVNNATGNETGVTVNGIVANVYGNQFTASHVPLTEGANTITVTARDKAANAATATITVNAVTTGNYIRLTSDTEAGISPLETTLRIDGSFSIDNSTISVIGPAQPQIVNISPSEYTVTMTTEGIYYFTATVTGPDGNVYQDTNAIVVFNKTQVDSQLKSTWENMKAALVSNNIDGALSYFGDFSKDKYKRVFLDLGTDLPSIISSLPDIVFVSFYGNVAEYAINRLEDGINRLYFIYFIRDESGLWKIGVTPSDWTLD